MLLVWCSIYDFFKLMLIVLSNSALDSIKKDLGFAQTLTKEGLEFFPGDENISLIFYLLLVLLPAKQGYILKKNSCKEYPVLIFDINDYKIVLTLLKEVIILQVGLTAIHV